MKPDEITVDDCRALQAYAYAVINPLQVEESMWADLPLQPIVPDVFKTQPELFPLLLVLDDLDSDMRVGLLDRMDGWQRSSDFPFFSALLQSDASPKRIRFHVANQMVRKYQHGADLLRPHDPRVFRHMTWLLTQAQCDGLLGPIQAWAWREPDGSWRQLTPEQLTDSRPFRLQPAQWQSYARLGLINRLIVQLADERPEFMSDAPTCCEIDEQLDLAYSTYGLTDTDDQFLFAEQVLRYHPRIHTHQVIAERLDNAQAEDASYVGACADLDDAAMRQLAIELDSNRQGTVNDYPSPV